MRFIPLLASLLLAPAAWSFTLDTVATAGCHERITLDALERAGWPDGRTAPLVTEDERVLARNVQFRTPPEADAWMLSLLIGVRHNDLGGASATNLPNLAAVQNGEGHQHDHCLRELDDDSSGGDQRALAACREYILGELEIALGLGDTPELDETELRRVDLAFTEGEVPVTQYAFHLGRASHALEDGFAHTFRTDDFRTVVSVLTYIGPILGASYRPEVDGYAHQSSMDSCDENDPEAAARAEAATTALAELYTAMNGPGDHTTRIQRANVVLDRWFSYAPGCTAENLWCGHASPAAGCSAGAGAPLLLLAALVLGLRRRRPLAKAVALGAALVASTAIAEEHEAAVPPFAVETTVADPEPTRRAHPVSLHLASGGSLDNPGFVVTLGARLQLSRRFILGLDAEVSPWFDLIAGRSSPGTFNAYASGTLSWFTRGSVEVRTAVQLGTSVLLFAAPGARQGSVGLFAGITLLQLLVHLNEHLALELSPEIVVAVPALKGVPLAYRQYRTSLGVQWTF